MQKNQPIPQRALTHAGKFHADDVFSAALLRILNPEVKVLRAHQPPADFDGMLFDIGGGMFDHHQHDAPVRENGVPYAAFGLLWRAFGSQLLEGRDVEAFDRHFIQPIDLDDNTGKGDPIAEMIGNFNPSWDSQETDDSCFWQAVEFAQVILQKRFEALRAVHRARELVGEALAKAKDGIVVLPRYAPWKFTLYKSSAKFVVYPAQRGGFSAQAVTDEESGQLKCPFPQEWAGQPEQTLPILSGIETLRFCHNSCFLIAAGSQEDAIAACYRALEVQKEEEDG